MNTPTIGAPDAATATVTANGSGINISPTGSLTFTQSSGSNGILNFNGAPVTVTSTVCHTPSRGPRVDCAATPVTDDRMPSRTTSKCFTVHLLDAPGRHDRCGAHSVRREVRALKRNDMPFVQWRVLARVCAMLAA